MFVLFQYFTPKYQFNGKDRTTGEEAGFMLNTDFALFYDMDIDTDNGQCLCDVNIGGTCLPGNTFTDALEFANVK